MKHNSYLNTLAVLLANENLKLAFTTDKTAYINLKTRTIYLPTYTVNIGGSDIILSERLICHEVAHALYTPIPREKEKTIYDLFDSDILNENHHSFFQKEYNLCYNVILILDDIRIENLFLKKFTGVGNLFSVGWKKYIEHQNIKITDDDQLTFLSKANQYFKSNKSMFYDFNQKESEFIEQISNLYTIDDLFNLTYTIGNYLLTSQQKSNKIDLNFNNSEIGVYQQDNPIDDVDIEIINNEKEDDGEMESNEFSGDIKLNNLSGNGDENSTLENESNDSEDDENLISEDEIGDGEISIDEKKNLLEDLEKSNELFKQNTNKNEYYVETITHKELSIISSKLFWDRIDYKLNEVFYIRSDNFVGYSDKILNQFINDIYDEIKNNVNILDIEFHRLKKAKEHRRVINQPTGSLNLSKLHSYQTSKNLFKTIQKTPKGKNHEFIIYLDWSCSIWNELSNLVKEVCTIILFCHKNKIDFRVFGFMSNREFVNTLKLDNDKIVNNASLIEFISSNDDFEKTIKKFLKLAAGYKFRYNCGIDLGSTPLYSTLMRSTDLFKQLVSNNDKHINLMVFSDGSSDIYENLYSICNHKSKLFDQVTGKIYHHSNFISNKENENTSLTTSLFKNELMFNLCFDRLKTFVKNLKITTIHIGNSYNNGFISVKNPTRTKMNNYIFSKSKHYTNFSINSSSGENNSFSEFIKDDTKLIDISNKEAKKIISQNLKNMNSSLSRILYKHIAQEIA